MNKKLRISIIIAALLFLVIIGIYNLIPQEYKYYEQISNHAYDITELIVVILVFQVFRLLGPKSLEGKVWLFLGLGMFCWLIGDLTWTSFVYLGIDPFPSIADVIFIIAYFFMLTTFIFEYKLLKENITTRSKIISGVAAGTIFLLMVSTVLVPIALAKDYSTLDKIVSLFYPIADLVILFFSMIFILTFGKAKASISWRLIGLGFFFWSIADTLAVYFNWIEIVSIKHYVVYIAGLILIGLGAYYHKLIMEGN